VTRYVLEPPDCVGFALHVLKNYGADVECGACMEIAFTGSTTNEHTCNAEQGRSFVTAEKSNDS